MTMQAKAAPTPGIPRCRPARVPTTPALGNSPGAGRAPLSLRGFIPDPDMLTAYSAEEKRLRRRAAIEALIEQAIEALDALDGDTELEPDNDDCCGAHDDDMIYRWSAGGIGDEADNELDADAERDFVFGAPSPACSISFPARDLAGRPGRWASVR